MSKQQKTAHRSHSKFSRLTFRATGQASGHRTKYTYDSIKRLVASCKEGIAAGGGYPAQADIINQITYDAYGRKLGQTNLADGLTVWESTVYDLAGRPLTQRDAKGLITSHAYALGGLRVTTTLPSNATRIEERYLDGRLKSITGSGVVNEYHEWALEELLYQTGYLLTGNRMEECLPIKETVHYGSPSSERVAYNWYDQAGRQILTKRPSQQPGKFLSEFRRYGACNWSYPKHLFRIYRIGDDENMSIQKWDIGPMGLLTNNIVQEWQYTPDFWTGDPQQYSDFNIQNETATTKRCSGESQSYAKINGHWFYATTNTTYLTDNDPTPTITSVELQRLTGFSSGNVAAEVTMWDADTNSAVVTTYVDRGAKKSTTVVNTAQSTLDATSVTINGLLQSESTPTVSTPTRHYYDAFGRETSIRTPLGPTVSKTYNQSGQVATVTDLTGGCTTYEYYPNGQYGFGQVKSQTSPSGKKTYYSYSARGELLRTWGDVPYPEERIYNTYGELVELHTFRDGTDWNKSYWPTVFGRTGSTNKTIWTYQPTSGLLLAKTDDSNQSVQYTYLNGMVATRSWARGVVLTNTYTGFGELASLEYSDGTPAVYITNYSRAGLPQEIRDATGTNVLSYDHAGRLVLSTNIDGTLVGVAVSNHFNAVYGRDRLEVLGLSTPVQHEFGYDSSSGRMATVGAGDYWASYGYVSDSDLLETTTYRNNGTPVLTTTRTWEYGMRLYGVANAVDGAVVSSHNYEYDLANRRTAAYLEDGSRWEYRYNDRDELISGKRYWPDWTPYSGQQFAYDYDTIGNRRKAWSGGNSQGDNLRETLYYANSLNQYTNVQTPGHKHIAGAAFATNAVYVNSATTERRGEWFDREISIDNTNSPVWQAVSVTDGTVTTNGGFAHPKNNQMLAYDLDGNLTSDGVWAYEWDGENRLKSMTMTNLAGVPNAQRKRLEFGYDFMGRRFSKVVYAWNGGVFTGPSTNYFVYDGWNLLATFTPQLSTLNSFLWGQDLSGTMNKAGGVGGLLAVLENGNGHFTMYDGNGNITGLIKADKTPSARYEYSPFGETLTSTGPLASVNPFRFSTKFHDDESGLVYYGYRYYSPTLGRWINRDPAEEQGGINLCAFLLNSPLTKFDTDGRWPATLEQWDWYGTAADAASWGLTGSGIPGLDPLLVPTINLILAIDVGMSGALLHGIVGRAALPGLLASGPMRSWATSGLAARLSAITVVGRAAAGMLAGTVPTDPYSTDGLAHSFVQSAMAGDTVWAELDAALLGLSIAYDRNIGQVTSLRGGVGLLNALRSGNGAAIAAALPSYTALNAWDMLSEIELGLEGL